MLSAEAKTRLDISSDGDIEASLSAKSTIRIVLLVEYDGSRYRGFQLQQKLPVMPAGRR